MKKLCLAALLVPVFICGCEAPGPSVAVQSSPPPVIQPVPPRTGYVTTYAPDYYVWDGYEYIGVTGDQYVYWSGGTWASAPPVILGRFHGWERHHPDWRRNAYRNHREPRWDRDRDHDRH